jgi:hypothetical protein
MNNEPLTCDMCTKQSHCMHSNNLPITTQYCQDHCKEHATIEAIDHKPERISSTRYCCYQHYQELKDKPL